VKSASRIVVSGVGCRLIVRCSFFRQSLLAQTQEASFSDRPNKEYHLCRECINIRNNKLNLKCSELPQNTCEVVTAG
jgi:hypothetical protein